MEVTPSHLLSSTLRLLTHPEISDLQLLENQLRDLGNRKRRGEIQGPSWTDEQGDQTRSALLELYEDVVVSDTSVAASRGLDDKIWNLVFYSRIEELRNVYRKVLMTL